MTFLASHLSPLTSLLAVARFPKPDFTSGYQYPEIVHGMPWETFCSWVDVVLLVGLMSLVAWAVHRRPSRRIVFSVSIVSVLYFGFFRTGCVCSIGSIQNVVLSIADSSYRLQLVVLLLFLLPLVFALFFVFFPLRVFSPPALIFLLSAVYLSRTKKRDGCRARCQTARRSL